MQTIDFLVEQKLYGLDDAGLEQIKTVFHKKHIKVSYEKPQEGKRRVIFSCSKKDRNNINSKVLPFECECNGLILEALKDAWRALVIPMKAPKSTISGGKVNNWLRDDLYYIHYLKDGTTINLYHYNGKWVISTARGYDMNDVKFNDLTYQELLDQCIASKKIDPKKFYSSLKPEYCYTLGFRHPDIHPFKEGEKSNTHDIWRIQRTELASSKVLMAHNELSVLPSQAMVMKKVVRVHDLYENNKAALNEFMNGGSPNYGYVLTSKDHLITGDHSVIILESSLMRTIRNLWYNGNYILYSAKNNYDRINIILLNSYLDNTRNKLFLALFPEYTDEFVRITRIESDMLNAVHTIIKNRTTPESKDSKDSESKEEPEEELVIENIYNTLADVVMKTIDINLYQDPFGKIKDILHSNEFIHTYYKLCYSQRIDRDQ